MNIGMVFTVFKKEILDIIRDRRTLIFMVLLPLLFIPVLMSLMQGFMLNSQKKMAARTSVVAVIGEEDAPQLVNYLQNEEKERYQPSGDEDVNAFMIDRNSGVNAFIDVRTDIDDEAEAQELLRQKELDAIVVIPVGLESTLEQQRLATGGINEEAADVVETANAEAQPTIRIDHVSVIENSDKAYDRLRNSLRSYSKTVVDDRLQGAGILQSFIEPLKIQGSDIATQQERTGEILGRILPYLIILMTFAGATFPAIQLGAGEKEQKTLETLLVSPVGRMEMVTGKFLTIVLTGMISAILSLAGMYYSFSLTGKSAGLADMLTLQLDIPSLLFAALLIIPLALIFAALLLTLSVLAKSFREAQSYMGPLNMLVILPAFASFLPGVELNTWLSMVPVMNVSLVLRQILAGKMMTIAPYYVIAFVSTFVLALIAIFICAAMFKREKTVFNT
jgi:sodium transport system permease protein